MTEPINLGEARSLRVDIVTARRKEIAERYAELKQTSEAATKEMNQLYNEDQELQVAEKTIRKLMERKK